MHPYLLPSLEFGPQVMRRMLEFIPELRWDEPSPGDRFSPREVIAHLADWEPVLLDRIKAGVETPGATVQGYDEGQWAIDHEYSTTDPREQVGLYAQRRAETAAYLRALAPDDWEKTVVHSERGVMTVYDQANLLLGHDLYHLEQLAGFMA